MTTAQLITKLKAHGADTGGALQRFMGNAELYRTFLGRFADDGDFTRLDECLLSGDADGAFSSAHSLKGAAGNLGLTALYNALSDLAEALRKQGPPEAVLAARAAASSELLVLRGLLAE